MDLSFTYYANVLPLMFGLMYSFPVSFGLLAVLVAVAASMAFGMRRLLTYRRVECLRYCVILWFCML